MKKIILNFSWMFIVILLACFGTSCGKKYTVTFMDGDTILKTEEVKKGETALGVVPTKEGYDFAGWTISTENVTEDITTYAVFTPKTYTVKFYVLNELYDTKTCLYNENAQKCETIQNEYVKSRMGRLL